MTEYEYDAPKILNLLFGLEDAYYDLTDEVSGLDDSDIHEAMIALNKAYRNARNVIRAKLNKLAADED